MTAASGAKQRDNAIRAFAAGSLTVAATATAAAAEAVAAAWKASESCDAKSERCATERN